jgi:hypothetical protein
MKTLVNKKKSTIYTIMRPSCYFFNIISFRKDFILFSNKVTFPFFPNKFNTSDFKRVPDATGQNPLPVSHDQFPFKF